MDLMIWEMLRMAPLLGALLVPSDREKWPPAWLCAFGLRWIIFLEETPYLAQVAKMPTSKEKK
jgi:hypothetical protein